VARKGPLPKGRTIDRRNQRAIVPVAAVPSPEVPDPEADWLDATKEQWEQFWLAPISQMVEETERAIVKRLFQYRDQHARATEIVRTSPIVKGSVGQVRMNPLAGYVVQLENAMLRLETELGLTPLARQRLGYAFGEAARSLSQMMQDDELARRRREERAQRLAES